MGNGSVEPVVSLAEAQAFARVETGTEEALLAGLIRSASGLCEAFLGQVVIARAFSEQLTANAEWQRLNVGPVRSIETVSVKGINLAPTSYATDIDAAGCGWVQLIDPSITGVVEVSGTAGLAAGVNEVPEAIRHGVLRLVAHLFAGRDGQGGEIPAAVTALWRPYRRMRLR